MHEMACLSSLSNAPKLVVFDLGYYIIYSFRYHSDISIGFLTGSLSLRRSNLVAVPSGQAHEEPISMQRGASDRFLRPEGSFKGRCTCDTRICEGKGIPDGYCLTYYGYLWGVSVNQSIAYCTIYILQGNLSWVQENALSQVI